jgi:hypothetical protein
VLQKALNFSFGYVGMEALSLTWYVSPKTTMPAILALRVGESLGIVLWRSPAP